MSRRAAVLAMLEEAVHGGADHVELHLATPQRWRNAVRPRLLEEFGSSSQQQQPVFPLFYEQGGCGGGVRVHPLYWSLGPDEMCVTVEYTALNALGQPVDGHVTGAEIQSTSDFYLAAVQLREAMGDSFGPETPSGSPELPVSLLPAVGISKGVRSAKGTFEVQLAKRWDTGLELYSIAPLALPHGQAPGYSNNGDMGGGAGEAMMVGGDSSTTKEAETGQQQVADTPAAAAGSAGETQSESRFSLPSDTESAIVTKIGETLGFWVAGDDITYDTFEHRDLLAKEITTLHASASEALSSLWRIAAPGSRPPAAIDPEKNGNGGGRAEIGAALTDTAPLPLPMLHVL